MFAVRLAEIITLVFHLSQGVGYSDAQPGGLNHRQIIDVVANGDGLADVNIQQSGQLDQAGALIDAFMVEFQIAVGRVADIQVRCHGAHFLMDCLQIVIGLIHVKHLNDGLVFKKINTVTDYGIAHPALQTLQFIFLGPADVDCIFGVGMQADIKLQAVIKQGAGGFVAEALIVQKTVIPVFRQGAAVKADSIAAGLIILAEFLLGLIDGGKAPAGRTDKFYPGFLDVNNSLAVFQADRMAAGQQGFIKITGDKFVGHDIMIT